MATAQDRAELRRIGSRDHPRRPPAAGGEGEGGLKIGRRGAIIIGIGVVGIILVVIVIRAVSNRQKQRAQQQAAPAPASDTGATSPQVDVSVTQSDGGDNSGAGTLPIAPPSGTITPAGPPLPAPVPGVPPAQPVRPIPIHRVPQPLPPAPVPILVPVYQVQPHDTSLDAIAAKLGKHKTQLHIGIIPSGPGSGGAGGPL